MLKNKISKKDEFSYVFNEKKYLRLNSLTIQYAKRLKRNGYNHPRYGIIASRKIGNAVKRNFAKRRIKALENIICTFGSKNFDYVLVAKKNILVENFYKLSLELKYALIKIKKITS